MATGTVKFYNPETGQGFIQADDGSGAIFLQVSGLSSQAILPHEGGDGVKFAYVVATDAKGRKHAASAHRA